MEGRSEEEREKKVKRIVERALRKEGRIIRVRGRRGGGRKGVDC